jgi:hypothetical protein
VAFDRTLTAGLDDRELDSLRTTLARLERNVLLDS